MKQDIGRDNRDEEYTMKQTYSGYSLIELLIVIAIISIIATVAIPAYQNSVTKGSRSDGRAALLDAQAKLERYFYTNKTYTQDLTDLGYSLSTAQPSSEGKYTLKVLAATAGCPIVSCYKLSATGVGKQASDGDLTLDSAGQKLPAKKW